MFVGDWDWPEPQIDKNPNQLVNIEMHWKKNNNSDLKIRTLIIIQYTENGWVGDGRDSTLAPPQKKQHYFNILRGEKSNCIC